VLEVLRAASRWLAQRGIDAPRLSAELLLAHVLGVSRLELYLQFDRPLGDAERARLRELIARRGRAEPVPFLTGSCDFHGVALAVEPGVLIPRPETEGLVDRAIELAPAGARCLELGTGSGAIAVALACARPDLSVVAIDSSPLALRIAARNVERHRLGDRVELRHGDFWQAVAPAERFRLLVSNPPYVDPAQPELLAEDVRRHEPPEALYSAPGDPASCYRAILDGLGEHLEPGSWLLFETGAGAVGPAQELLHRHPRLDEVQLAPDLAGLPRYLTARLVSTTACEAT
jgi:release factor glutamine methyltransferase